MPARKPITKKQAETELYNPEDSQLPIDVLRTRSVAQIDQLIKDLMRLRGTVNNYNPSPGSANIQHYRSMLVGWSGRLSEVAARGCCAIGLLLTRVGQE